MSEAAMWTRAFIENASDAIAVLTEDGEILDANPRWAQILGLPMSEIVGRRVADFATHGDWKSLLAKYIEDVARPSGRSVIAVRRADGKAVLMDFSLTIVELDGRRLIHSIGRDVTASVHAIDSLAAAEEKYRSLLERIPDVVWSIDARGALTFITPNVERVLGFTAEELMDGGVELVFERTHRDDLPRIRACHAAFLSGTGAFLDCELRFRRKDGRWVQIQSRSSGKYVHDGVVQCDGVFSDITAQRQLEESLRLSQKMEAIGRLTGGIAHDFNNVLAAILANSHFLINDLGEHDPRRADAEEIREAANRAASLTRQLLAFSRRQVLAPTVLDLNAVVAGLDRMLRRLIGEDIDFQIVPAADVGAVRADVGQLEQVIMNLVVNARDAMPTGGKLTIETADVELDGPYAAEHPPVTPGGYVMLAITDTGCGMDAETKRRLFEPFFTTKEQGKGTGLGLSTSYGIVKQSGGFIWCYSEPGRGTTFKIYLPRAVGRPVDAPRRAPGTRTNGRETILLIEDDARVRSAVTRILEERGYRLVVARDAGEAIALARTHGDTIDLALSDVIIPGVTGPEAVAEILKHAPRARTLFMSGYTDHAVLRHELISSGTTFIQKPFSPDALALKVREVLDAPSGA